MKKTKADAAWRVENAGSLLGAAKALFERDVLNVFQASEFQWVTQVHLALFRNLDLNGTRLTDLATRACITKQSMQELVDKAEAFGVVERRAVPDDRRAKIVAFTPSGLRMLELFRVGVALAERRVAQAIGRGGLHDIKAQLAAYVRQPEAPARRPLRARSKVTKPLLDADGVSDADPVTNADQPRRLGS